MKILIITLIALSSAISAYAKNENQLQKQNNSNSQPRIIIQCGDDGGGQVQLNYKPEDIIIQTLSLSIDQSVIDSIEYALKTYNIKEIVILGDEIAFNKYLDAKGFRNINDPKLTAAAKSFLTQIQARYKETETNDSILFANQLNLDFVAKDLLEQSTILKKSIAEKNIIISKELRFKDQFYKWN